LTTNMPALIMDAAEKRIRVAGYNGFSFRDLAADVGIKSASVHYHFPTKAILGAAVLRRYTDRFMQLVNTGQKAGSVKVWREAFRRALQEDGRVCLCGMLGAEVGGLPPEIVLEVQRFFESGVNSLISGFGKPSPSNRAAALRVLATLEGAMLLARVFNDSAVFDQATEGLDGGLSHSANRLS
jgi:TetR/AcrR family transcriptional regulator, transcriptional repressor for nem operon